MTPTSLPQKTPCILGESPHWDHATQTLFWVDIYGKMIFQYHPNTETINTWHLPEMVGHVIPTSKNKVLISMPSGIYTFSLSTQTLSKLSDLEPLLPNNRPNDGKCDPSGRLWVGTIDFDFKPGASSLYRLDGPNQLTQVLSGLTLANGLAWDTKQQFFYFIDSLTQSVQQFDYCPKTGDITHGRTAFAYDKELGIPDGMCIDADGMLWIAGFDGGQVSRFNPKDGRILNTLKLPTPYPTACTIGGKNNDTLFITSSSHLLTREAATKAHCSGLTFQVTL